jgi:hypothetical protein
MRPVRLSILLLALAGNAHAEDFTGFYAGLNAGYAWGRERDRAVSSPATGPVFAPGRGGASDLPPSARDAAAALRRSEPGNTTARTRR